MGAVALLVSAMGVPAASGQQAGPSSAGVAAVRPAARGELDCNNLSPVQRSVRPTLICADVRGIGADKFEENGRYVGHDEPTINFYSHKRGSGNTVTWVEKLPVEPKHLPTVHSPGHDITHSFELAATNWFSMAYCDNQSYPQLPCTPESDRNAPHGAFPGGGSGLLELQFYPPGFAPIMDAQSCDNTHWCAAMTLDSLEFTAGFQVGNPNCTEPVNFAFVQRDGIPTGPPSPQLADVSTFTPTAKTLLMRSGDTLRVSIHDVAVGPGQLAMRARVDDLTTHQSGFMTSSARNGFMHTSIVDCSGTPYNFAGEYDTAGTANILPWGIGNTNIASDVETGHFIPCTGLTNPGTFTFGAFTDTFFNNCSGPYESSAPADDPAANDDPPCYPKGDTHGGLAAPDEVTGCEPVTGPFPNNADLDFDGTPYWPDWPISTRPTRFPSTFLQHQPTTSGARYSQVEIQTDLPAFEPSCQADGTGCAIPAPGAPGHFYPWWTLARVGGACAWEFGQMHNGLSFGQDAQYNHPNPQSPFEWTSGVIANPRCA
ncbi:hypothetical protein M6D93_03090 [Jatrophihabitans telluris]|uniref:Secreted protein n=1 Tax=Jatrophihabitans telluris TaxID=2038343 RepID=A0ABY4R0Z0_9ACTN|nr:hypothetical protein [Jatrophihabitans telluris]UQX88992.1 hypothetical protein M6D93_03090 [Jatrophihabitans telluris]